MRSEILGSRMGIAGIAILAALVAVSAATAASVPLETFKKWNDPTEWILLPKSAVPAWANDLDGREMAEHMVLDSAELDSGVSGGIARSTAQHAFWLDAGGVPDGFIYEYSVRYEGSPLLRIDVLRPDGARLAVFSAPLPDSGGGEAEHSGRVFSSDASIARALGMHESIDGIFSGAGGGALEGGYALAASVYGVGRPASFESSVLVIGGGAYGLMGTDDLRRDLAVGLLWGTPLALFVGVSVAVASVALGMAYGMYAGYRGGRADESMMRLNDVVYALPALPFLIILAVTVSSSILVMVGFLVVFGWVGVAKVSRSMSLQAREHGYVEASRMMGQRDSRVILRHIMPQLLPYALASIAISVPAAITTEAGISFLGLGDPEFPTWGHMLHDASSHGAAARGLWWWIAPPGVMIALTGLAFVFIGGAIDAAVNPRAARR